MKVTPTAISEVLVFEPQVNGGARGFFFESFNARRFEALSGQRVNFVEHNHNRSAKNARLALPVRQPQGKLVRIVAGAVFDVVVDLRAASPFFRPLGRHLAVGRELAPDMGAAWLRARLPGHQRQRRMPVQNDRLPGSQASTLDPVERPGAGDRLADQRRADRIGQR